MSDRDRFACPCCGENMIDPRLVELVDRIEEDIQERLGVNSGYRCPAHNVGEGGKSTSSHLGGLAVDVDCQASRLRFRLVQAAMKNGIHRIGIGKSFVHLDIDRAKDPRVIWLY